MTKHMSADERTSQILDAAKRCFLQKGYSSTRMDEIASEAGLSKGGVYFHFNSKRAIFEELVQHEYRHAIAIIDQIAEGPGNLLHKLLSMGKLFTELFAESDNPRPDRDHRRDGAPR